MPPGSPPKRSHKKATATLPNVVLEDLLALEELYAQELEAERIVEAILADPRCSEPQRAFILDESRFKVACCSRQAGKTYADMIMMIITALRYPKSTILYMGLTDGQSRQTLIKDIAGSLNEDFGIGWEQRLSPLSWTFKNGSVITVRGGDGSNKAAGRIRGSKYKLVVIDETQDYDTDVEYLIKEAAGAGAVSGGGQIVMTGTPGLVHAGMFYRACHKIKPDNNWSHHHWTWEHNQVTRPLFQKFIEEQVANDPDWLQLPKTRREYFGEWKLDDSVMPYVWNATNLDVKQLPKGHTWKYVIGMDFGFRHPYAWAVFAWSDKDPNIYIIKAESKVLKDVTAACEYTKEHYADKFPGCILIGDGARPEVIAEMVNRHKINIVSTATMPGGKLGKEEFVRLMAGDLRLGRIKILPAAQDPVINEWAKLVYKKKEMEMGKLVIDETTGDHISDAALYAWRWCYNHAYRPLKPKPTPLTPSQQMEAQVEREVKLRKRVRLADDGFAGPSLTDDPEGISW